MIILTMVFLAPFFSDLPDAVLGAIIIEAVTMGMMDVPEMRRILRVKRIAFLAAAAALLGVLTFGIIQGVFIGVGIFFANAEVLADFLRELRVRSELEGHGLKGVVLSMEAELHRHRGC